MNNLNTAYNVVKVKGNLYSWWRNYSFEEVKPADTSIGGE